MSGLDQSIVDVAISRRRRRLTACVRVREHSDEQYIVIQTYNFAN